MKNIFEIMNEYGLEVPEDKRKDFVKAVLENYKTINLYIGGSGNYDKIVLDAVFVS